MSESKQKQHVDYQKQYFDTNCGFFRQPIPDDVVSRTRHIVQLSKMGAGNRVLDVGTGMGVLVQHFLEAGVRAQDIVGVDLSASMLAEARKRYPDVTFWEGDFANLPADVASFDAVFFNACFGNLFDQDEAISQSCARLNSNGRIIISHPMGNSFVLQLKEQDPQLVLSPLPSEDTLSRWCAEKQLRVVEFQDEPLLYVAILQKA